VEKGVEDKCPGENYREKDPRIRGKKIRSNHGLKIQSICGETNLSDPGETLETSVVEKTDGKTIGDVHDAGKRSDRLRK